MGEEDKEKSKDDKQRKRDEFLEALKEPITPREIKIGLRSFGPTILYQFFEAQDPKIAPGADGNRFIPKHLGDFLLRDFRFLHFKDSEEMYSMLDGVYEPYGENFIMQCCNDLLGKEFSSHRFKEVKAYIESANSDHVKHVTHEEVKLPESIIPFNNGILDIKTMTMTKDDSSCFLINRLPVKYDTGATCPNFMAYLNSSVPDETDRKTLQQYTGICLTTTLKYHKALFLVGPTHSGKSTFCKVIKAMFGAYCTNIPLQRLMFKEWERARLYGKFVNVFPDIPKDDIQNDSWFLALLGDDYISAALKYHNSFDFRCTTKQIFTANKLPKTHNHSDEFFIRVILVYFPNMFLPGTPDYDPNILEKLTTPAELSGIVNWALEGLQEVEKNAEITQRLDLEDTQDAWELVSDSLSRFCRSNLEEDAEHTELKDVIYQAYIIWCKEAKEVPLSSKSFYEGFREHFPHIIETRLPTEKRKRIFKGIRLISQEKLIQHTLSDRGQDVQGLHNEFQKFSDGEDNKEMKGETLDISDGNPKQCEQPKSEKQRSEGTTNITPSIMPSHKSKRTRLSLPCSCGGQMKSDIEADEVLATAYCEKCTSTFMLRLGLDGWKVVEEK